MLTACGRQHFDIVEKMKTDFSVILGDYFSFHFEGRGVKCRTYMTDMCISEEVPSANGRFVL